MATLEALNSPPSAGSLFCAHEDTVDHRSWSKGKRTKRSHLDSSHIPPSEEEYLALCLLMLAQGGERGGRISEHRPSPPPPPPAATCKGYTCTVCHRVFPSYQALGGHKASHKNKPVTEDRQAAGGGGTPSPTASSQSTLAAMIKKPVSMNPMSNSITRTHRCSICLKTFASGQALGGHKRRHFEGGSTGSTGSAALTEDTESGHSSHHGYFDLNLPASPEHYSREANSIDFRRKSQLSGDKDVVSALPMMIGPDEV